MTLEQLKQIGAQLRDPIMIFRGAKPNTIVTVTGIETDKEKSPGKTNVIVSVLTKARGKSSDVNKITSVYGKDELARLIDERWQSGQVLAYNQEETDKLFTVIGCQSTQATSALCFNHSIAYSLRSVKGKLPEIAEKSEKTPTPAPSRADFSGLRKRERLAERPATPLSTRRRTAGKTRNGEYVPRPRRPIGQRGRFCFP